MKIAVIASISALALAGCVTSPVAELTPGVYTLSVDASFGGASRSALSRHATGEAQDYCAQQQKTAKLINQNDAGFMHLTSTSTTIAFRCVVPVKIETQ